MPVEEGEAIVARAVATAAAWGINEAETEGVIAGVRGDADGLTFTTQLLEALAQSPDPFVAALRFRAVSRTLPKSLPQGDRFAVQAGSLASLAVPWAVLPIARRRLRERLAPLVLVARTPDEITHERQLRELHEELQQRTDSGAALALRPLGDPVLGPEGVAQEIGRLIALAGEPLVTRLIIDPARLAPGSDWSLDADVRQAARELDPLCEAASDHGTTLHFAPTDFRGARLITHLLTHSSLSGDYSHVTVAVTLAAELPESWQIAQQLISWSRDRAAGGGQKIELTIGFGRFGAHETAHSLRTGLPVPVLTAAEAQQAQWLRLVRFAAQETQTGAISMAVASEDPLLLAAATNIASDYGIARDLVVQLRAGAATPLGEALLRSGSSVRIELPISSPNDFASVAPYVLALATEAADPESALAAEPASNTFARAIAAAHEPPAASHRIYSRAREWDPSERDSALFYRAPADTERLDTGGLTAAVLGLQRIEDGTVRLEQRGEIVRVPNVSASGFANEPATDPVIDDNREWVRSLLQRAAGLRAERAAVGVTAARETVDIDADTAEIALSDLLQTTAPWGAQPPRERATRLRRLALAAAAGRDRLMVELAAETGAPVPVLDSEVNGTIDAARYVGDLADGLGALRGAQFRPDALTLIVVEAGIPLAERAETLLTALAAGSAVICISHPSVYRSTLALVEEWQAAELPLGLITLVQGGTEVAAQYAADERIDRAMVLGSREAARALIRRRPHLRVDGRFRAPGTVIVSASADPITAAQGIVESAFGGGAVSARSARAVILVGSALRSPKLTNHLADAVRALRAGDTAHTSDISVTSDQTDAVGSVGSVGSVDPLAFDVGPLPVAPSPEGLRAMTELEPGEAWLVEPQQLDDAGRLWRPGVRVGLRVGSSFWRDAAGMPVIGLIGARSFDEALRLQHALGGGGVAALYSGAADELIPWLDRSQAASLTVNRATEPAAIERLPGGGWGSAGMGVETLAGGPNRLVTMGSWKLRVGSKSSTLHLRGLDPEIQMLIETAQSVLDYETFDRVRRAALSDALAWRTTLGRVHDEVGLAVETNLMRRWPVATQIRLAEEGPLAGLVRVLSAALLVRAPIAVSTGVVLPKSVTDFLSRQGVTVWLERDADWLERLAIEANSVEMAASRAAARGIGAATSSSVPSSLEATGEPLTRVRLIGGDPVRTAEWLGGQDRVSIWADPVTMAGPVELLAFLREQSISVATHEHGLATTPPGLTEWITELDARSHPSV